MKIRALLAASSLAAVALVSTPGVGDPAGGPEGQLVWSPGYPAPKHDAVFSISAQSSAGPIASAVVEYGDGVVDAMAPPRSAAGDLAACLFGDTFNTTRLHTYAQVGDYGAKLTITTGSCPGLGALQPTVWSRPFKVSVIQPGTGQAPGPDQAQQPQQHDPLSFLAH